MNGSENERVQCVDWKLGVDGMKNVTVVNHVGIGDCTTLEVVICAHLAFDSVEFHFDFDFGFVHDEEEQVQLEEIVIVIVDWMKVG